MRAAYRGSAPALLLLTALVGCKEQGATQPAAQASGVSAGGPASAVFGAALSLTGPAGAYGSQQRAGIQAAVDEINRSGSLPVKIEVRIEDDASTKEQGITVFQKFINRDKVSAIIGPTLSNTASAADPLAQQARVPVLAISNTAATGITDIGNDDVFTKAGYDVMQKALADLGVKVLGTQTFAKPDRDYNAQLTAISSQKPDVLVISALADNAAAIVAQARQLGWTGSILGGNGFNSPAFIKNAGPAAEGVLAGTSWNSAGKAPANQRFLDAMKNRGASTDQLSPQAYTSVYT